MQANLRVIAGPDLGRVFPLTDGQTLIVGRGQASNTQLKDPHVSRTHFEVQADGAAFKLRDLGSAAGTSVNGSRQESCELKPGDLIKIGDTEMQYLLEGGEEQTTMMGATPPSPKVSSQSSERLNELVGQSLSHYSVSEKVAEGATGIVFKAEDSRDGKVVALKVLFPETSRNDDDMQRFVRAMKTVLPLKHPNIIQVYNAGKTGNYCWTAMEYVEGESLAKVIERIGTAGMLDWRNAFTVAVQITRALELAYQNKIIHRNITPENILLRKADSVAKLGDLMLAKALEGTLAEQVTRPGQLIGDIAYMAPERTRSGADVDTRADIYCLGATTYALLTGRPPFEGTSLPELISKIRQTDPVKPKEFQLSIPDQFQDVVLTMIQKRPEDRYSTPSELLTELERVAKYQGMTV